LADGAYRTRLGRARNDEVLLAIRAAKSAGVALAAAGFYGR
jgi:hypothetical protein